MSVRAWPSPARSSLPAVAVLLCALAVRSYAGEEATLEIYEELDDHRDIALAELRAVLDGQNIVIPVPLDTRDSALALYRTRVPSGPHELQVLATYRGRSWAFPYVEGYRFHMSGELHLKLEPGDRVGVQGGVLDRRDPTTRWEDRFHYTLRAASLRAPPPAAPEVQEPAPPAAAAPPPPPVFEVATCKLGSTRFAFSKADLNSDTKASLRALASCLAEANQSIRIVGHCDVRGSVEYNLRLGEQRARAAARYLESLGVAPSSIQVTSAGKSRPLCPELTRACHARNRRVEVERVQ